MPEMFEKDEIQESRAGDAESSVNMMNNSMSIYDIKAWQLPKENNLKGSMQLPIISKEP